MSRLVLHSQSPAGATINGVKRWSTSLGIWGASAAAGAVLFLSVTPLFKREVLAKVPLLDSYYKDRTPASDKPF